MAISRRCSPSIKTSVTTLEAGAQTRHRTIPSSSAMAPARRPTFHAPSGPYCFSRCRLESPGGSAPLTHIQLSGRIYSPRSVLTPTRSASERHKRYTSDIQATSSLTLRVSDCPHCNVSVWVADRLGTFHKANPMPSLTVQNARVSSRWHKGRGEDTPKRTCVNRETTGDRMS